MEKDLQNITSILKQHKLDTKDYYRIKDILDREPNLLEIGIFSAMWSEHCSYKSSRKYLKIFPTKASWVVQGPGENAGVIDLGKNICAVFKMESHNHPSFIEPYQGAATGVGGILRDIFTMGARPVANMNSLRFGNIEDKTEIGEYQKYLLKGVIAGISNYGNCMGIPTIGGETTFDDSYNGNIIVNAFSLGLVKKDEIFLGIAKGIGNSIMYVGAKTGRDGLGGAVMSSDNFSEDSKLLRPTVQVGDPFTEKLLLEACLELFKTKDILIGIQDMGAAGLTSSSFEMAGKCSSGIRLDLDKVPAKEEGMTPYEFMLAESQERMLLCVKQGKEQEVIDIFNKWDLEAVIIGEVTDDENMKLMWHNEIVADIPIIPLSEKPPILNRATRRAKYLDELKKENFIIKTDLSIQNIFIKLISSVNIADKSWIYEQYDSTVQTNSIKESGALDASCIRVKENGGFLAISTDCNPRYCYIDPYKGAAIAVMESGRNVVMSGAVPLAITDCLNFGNPENPEVMWQFSQSCEGIKKACLKLNTPVVSGNVSLYNETDSTSIFPTPAIAMVGFNKNENSMLPNSFQEIENYIFLIGDTIGEFGGSLLVKEIFNKVNGEISNINFTKELSLWKFILEANEKKLLKSAKDLSMGGLAIALGKMSAIGNIGIEAKINMIEDYWIFDESQSRAIIEVSEQNITLVKELVNLNNISIENIGKTKSKNFILNDINMSMNKLKTLYFNSFEQKLKS